MICVTIVGTDGLGVKVSSTKRYPVDTELILALFSEAIENQQDFRVVEELYDDGILQKEDVIMDWENANV